MQIHMWRQMCVTWRYVLQKENNRRQKKDFQPVIPTITGEVVGSVSNFPVIHVKTCFKTEAVQKLNLQMLSVLQQVQLHKKYSGPSVTNALNLQQDYLLDLIHIYVTVFFKHHIT